MGKTIDFCFSDKHKKYMKKALSCCINVAEGAVRAGKTVDNVVCFAYLLEHSPDNLHLATGSTASNALINIGDCNGMGLEHIFRGRCHYCKYKGCVALQVETASGTKTILFAGAAKSDSYKKIRGNSYGMWIATEINLHHSSAIKEAFNRQLAAKQRKIFWDLNPENPKAEIYRDYLDVFKQRQENGGLAGGYNYEHFTIYDNAAVSKERLEEIVSQYDKNSIWFRRDILGQRCSAEGLIYPEYANRSDDMTVFLNSAELVAEYSKKIDWIDIGIDFGGNRSLTAFVATGIHKKMEGITVLKDAVIEGRKGEIDPDRVYRELELFLISLKHQYPGIQIRAVRPDCAEQYLITGMRKFLASRFPNIAVCESIKRPILDRIRCLNALISTGRFHICSDCSIVDDGIRSAVWDANAAAAGIDRRADCFVSNIDIMDALEYSFEVYSDSLVVYQDNKSKNRNRLSAVMPEDFKGGWT